MKIILLMSLFSLNALASLPLITLSDVEDKYTSGQTNPMDNFTPSNLETKQELNNVFYSLKNTNKWTAKPNTQCFNRAHYWAKSIKDNFDLNTMKVHIYFTRKYARSVSDKWWFHVAPMLGMNGELFVLDETFFNKPVTLAAWENWAMRKLYRGNGLQDYRCKVIENISEFYEKENQENEFCNIQVSSMYYWEPSELEKLEKENIVRSEFSSLDLQTAVKNIFWHWTKIFNELKF